MPRFSSFSSFLSAFLLLLVFGRPMAKAQTVSEENGRNVRLMLETQTTVGGGMHTPLWLNANRYGLGGLAPDNGYLRLQMLRPTVSDSVRRFRHGVGFDVALVHGGVERLQIQQLYWETVRGLSVFTIGQKQRETELNHPELSTGAFVLGMNARPVPMAKWALRDWWNISGSKDWVALKLHLAYGMQTDGKWQRDYLSGTSQHYPMWALYHEKSGYLRLGNPLRHALCFVGGLEMATQFGGTIYNGGGFDGIVPTPIKGGKGLKNFFYALVGKGGSDATDGAGYGNSAGNTLGAWRAALDYRNRRQGWHTRLYYDHFFEDESAAFDEYGWLDGLWGVEIGLPPNPYVTDLVVEHVRTDYQSGPIYHDHTGQVPDQVSGVDNYYNHNLYQGWQNYGMAMGNALFASPLYNADRSLAFTANRFHATHFGMSGDPYSGLHYRLLYSYLKSWGTYAVPFAEVERQHSFLFETSYRIPSSPGRQPSRRSPLLSPSEGWRVKLGIAFDTGNRLGRHLGVQLSVSKSGWLLPTKSRGAKQRAVSAVTVGEPHRTPLVF
ncbi:hypothetical protein EII14_01690 [Alloprevotella sp. OH1205_COT-284]|uniref:capsule assembly Wzi family protein n=1 Tax=Alloprevotella sp. OH1205_COT-284 TaxID=2491043 RepID=UPI000F5DBEC2|nr:capsule assembly Wzi family protein [Alloprevotella sp. OH1205_COT-284]RRD80529.1 hypothetical protein EII14_01690 [Alloprevotella sp. OH1205_COT-284]